VPFATMRALQAAAQRLADHHVDVAVVHTPTLKPFDDATVMAEVDTDRLCLTLENHTVVGGLSRPWPPRRSGPGSAAASSRSRYLTPSSTPARCPPCTTATAWLATGSSTGC
jgi:transketolase